MNDLANDKKDISLYEDDYIGTTYKKIDGNIGLFSVFESIIKSPGKILYEISNAANSFKIIVFLIFIYLLSMTVFGAINGLFSGGFQILYSAVKYPLGLMLSALICFPSLYIFLSLTGIDISIKDIFGIFLMSLTLIAVIFLGFAPVLWIFSQSTNSIFFMGFLNMVFLSIAIFFGFRLQKRSLLFLAQKNNHYLTIWFIIFILVVFQMTATLRPLIGSSDYFLTTDKLFFLEYWFGK